MNKSELVDSMAAKAEISKKDADKALKAFIETVTEVMVEKGKVQLIGFGTFEVAERKERVGRNPKTNEEIVIPGGFAPKFKAGAALKDCLKN